MVIYGRCEHGLRLEVFDGDYESPDLQGRFVVERTENDGTKHERVAVVWRNMKPLSFETKDEAIRWCQEEFKRREAFRRKAEAEKK